MHITDLGVANYSVSSNTGLVTLLDQLSRLRSLHLAALNRQDSPEHYYSRDPSPSIVLTPSSD